MMSSDHSSKPFDLSPLSNFIIQQRQHTNTQATRHLHAKIVGLFLDLSFLNFPRKSPLSIRSSGNPSMFSSSTLPSTTFAPISWCISSSQPDISSWWAVNVSSAAALNLWFSLFLLSILSLLSRLTQSCVFIPSCFLQCSHGCVLTDAVRQKPGSERPACFNPLVLVKAVQPVTVQLTKTGRCWISAPPTWQKNGGKGRERKWKRHGKRDDVSVLQRCRKRWSE